MGIYYEVVFFPYLCSAYILVRGCSLTKCIALLSHYIKWWNVCTYKEMGYLSYLEDDKDLGLEHFIKNV